MKTKSFSALLNVKVLGLALVVAAFGLSACSKSDSSNKAKTKNVSTKKSSEQTDPAAEATTEPEMEEIVVSSKPMKKPDFTKLAAGYQQLNDAISAQLKASKATSCVSVIDFVEGVSVATGKVLVACDGKKIFEGEINGQGAEAEVENSIVVIDYAMAEFDLGNKDCKKANKTNQPNQFGGATASCQYRE